MKREIPSMGSLPTVASRIPTAAENRPLTIESPETAPTIVNVKSRIPAISIGPKLRAKRASNGATVTSRTMENIDPKRKVQISDKRNEEVTEKLASYHVIPNGKVTQERLKREDWTVPKVDGVAALSIGGVLTLGGELRVGRSKSGGFLGFGAKEDGGVVIGNNDAKVLKSTLVDGGVVHEVDGFVAPDLLWRYFDQLRIPGT